MSHRDEGNQNPACEYLWAPEVHVALGERLSFFFLRSAYNKLAIEALKEILEKSGLPTFSYVLFGQFDFLVRVWGKAQALADLEIRLREFSRRFLGDCIMIEAKKVWYLWGHDRPSEKTVSGFLKTLGALNPDERRKFVQKQNSTLKSKGLIIDEIRNRQHHQLKAFTVIRNLNLITQSYKLMEIVLKDEVKKFCNDKAQRDATLYSTLGDIHFIVRWGAKNFRDLVEAISRLIAALEDNGFAALFESYFKADTVGPERDGPVMLSEAPREQELQGANEERRWAEAVPEFKEATPDRRELFLHLAKAKEFNLSPDRVMGDQALRGVLTSYFQESIVGFGAYLSRFYSQFETGLRNRLFAEFWPSAANEQDEVLQSWQAALGKSQPLSTGTDSGKVVPKLTLGDLLKLARELRPDGFDDTTNRRLADLVRQRNELTHGTGSVDFDLFIPFLAQASACARLLNALTTKLKLPEK
jgi:hypothetical protein